VKFPAVTAAQMREVDRLMIEHYRITLEQMMESAGRNLAELARDLLGGSVARHRIAVLCGPGNNGGGGMVAARNLHNWGARVQAVVTGSVASLKETPARQWRILEKIGLTRAEVDLTELDLCIDALLGYGASGDPRGSMADSIRGLNTSGAQVLSLDLPSGLDATTGQPGQPCVRATATITLALPKKGLLAAQAAPFVGRLYLADIGVPPELYRGLGIAVGAPFAKATVTRVV
jgi:NAD(P)H-hydrate epimerase